MKDKIKYISEMLPLGELFILEALRHYSHDVLDRQEELYPPKGKHSFIAPELWIGNAEKILAKLDKK